MIAPAPIETRAPYNRITGCRACGSTDLEPILSLGETPLANALLTAELLDEPEATYPLEVVFCPHCSLMQLTVTLPPESLFRQYPYYSSFSEKVLANARTLADRMVQERRLTRSSWVVEIGSNDGYLLKNYLSSGAAALGVEPAQNIAERAQQQGVTTVVKFFDEALANELASLKGRVDVLHANNVLAHIADLNGTVAGIATLLREDGVAVIEAPYVKDLIDQCQFDTIYHEHLCYFSVTALDALFRRHGLILLDVERVVIHGGTLRYFVGKHGKPSPHVAWMLTMEKSAQVNRIDYYHEFGRRARELCTDLRVLLGTLKAQGKRIIVYSVPAKGCTLLHYAGIWSDILDYAVDIITLKQGRYTPGLRLPIYAPEKVLEDMPDFALLLAWNFADVILEHEAAYRQRGGKFIIPIPEVRIV
jgi:SAM-dependent methyltransferase